MSKHSKRFIGRKEFFQAAEDLQKFQKIHNILRNDYLLLLEMTSESMADQSKFNVLYRAAVKGIFSLVEADVFGLNNIDPYPDYSDQHRFDDKFKKTFTQICKTWKKPELRKEYFDKYYYDLKVLRKKREQLIHPKEVEHLYEANADEYSKLNEIFVEYDNFMKKLMDNFFIEVKIDTLGFLRR